MIQEAINQLAHLITLVPERVGDLSEEVMGHPPLPGKWSKKQILGHLVDSAINNHSRFIRAQYEPQPFLLSRYDQNKWVEINAYQYVDGKEILKLWTALNKQILRVIAQIPEERLCYQCQSSDQPPVTFAWVIVDYVDHLEHQLKQIAIL